VAVLSPKPFVLSVRHLPDQSLSADLERELGRQILVSEKLRSGIQAIVGTLLTVIVAIVGGVHLFQGRSLPAYRWALLIGVGAVIYELITREVFDRYLRQDRDVPVLRRYLNAAIETSIPTVVIIAFLKTMHPDLAMTSAAVLTYYFSLSFPRCVWIFGRAPSREPWRE
jgi:adenylate cyclase